ncbi:MAG: YbhB/YbcL family Raf kinase inhibitor-like protein [Chthoniobacterales bacterium]
MKSLFQRLAPALCAMLGFSGFAGAKELAYERTDPPLEVTFAVAGGHYSGVVTGGNLFLQSDISEAPVVRWKDAAAGKFYTLLMLDFDGNANGSWPDPVASGENSPVRHWIVGNIPGEALAGDGYVESANNPSGGKLAVLQPYRAPHIPMVSDRYGLYLFEQAKEISFAEVTGPITNFDLAKFLSTYQLTDPKAANFFVAIYTSESPFSGKAFQGNDVSKTWHADLGKGQLTK